MLDFIHDYTVTTTGLITKLLNSFHEINIYNNKKTKKQKQ